MGKTTEVGSSPTQQLKMDGHTPTGGKSVTEIEAKIKWKETHPKVTCVAVEIDKDLDFSF